MSDPVDMFLPLAAPVTSKVDRCLTCERTLPLVEGNSFCAACSFINLGRIMNVSLLLTATDIIVWARDPSKIKVPSTSKIKVQLIASDQDIWDSLSFLAATPPKKPFIYLPMKKASKASRVHAASLRLNYPGENTIALSGKPFEIPFPNLSAPLRETTMQLLSHIQMDRVRRMLTLPIKVLRGYGKNEELEKLGIARKDIADFPERALLL